MWGMSLFEWITQTSSHTVEFLATVAILCVGVNWIWRGYKAFHNRYTAPSDRAFNEASEVRRMHNEHRDHVDSALARDQEAIRLLQESDRLLLRGHMTLINYMIDDTRDTSQLEEVRNDINDHLLNR